MVNFSIFDYYSSCLKTPSTKYQSIALVLVNVPFILPLCLYILRLGVKQWRSRAKISHTDVFTYNMVTVQLFGIVGSCLITMNWAFHSDLMTMIGLFMLAIAYAAIIIFQILTSVERYLAAVYPVTYLHLKSQTWILIRNISCGLVWLLCIILSICFSKLEDLKMFYSFSSIGLSLCVFIVLFCNVCVLCVLIRPRPGDGVKGEKTKRRALYTITVIAGTLLVRFTGDMLGVYSYLFLNSSASDDIDKSCAMYFSGNWFSLPSTLVLPMLFLQRKGKLLCFKSNK